jgi:CheY-like chemotaxis protein
MARANPYDAVLMDIQMPELDGLQATAELRGEDRFAGLPIIAMTAHAMAGDREQSLAAGMDDHVTKPIDPDALFAVLLRWIKPGKREAVAARPEAPSTPPPPSPVACDGDDDWPGVDRIAGLRRLAGNEALYRKLLVGFHRDYASGAAPLRAAIDEGRADDAGRWLHTLKGVAGNIGAMDLHRAAQELESAMRVGDEARSAGLLPGLERELSRIVEGLGPLAREAEEARAEAEASGGPADGAVDRDALESSIRELSRLVRSNNPDAEAALEGVRAALNGARGKEVEGVAQALDMFDFRGAEKALADLATVEGVPLGTEGP